jgi:microcystin-dependent protein
MTLLYANNAAGTLAAAVAVGDTSLTLNAGQAAVFPIPTTTDSFYATITDALTQSCIEIVLVTAVNGNVFSVTRAQDGTTARSWNENDIISQRIVAAEARQWAVSVIPSGMITLWSGSQASIPEGWVLCNGLNGTPDLRNRFVVGSGGNGQPPYYPVGATGGNTSITLTTAQLPAHAHGITDVEHTHTYVDDGHDHTIATYSGWTNGANIDGTADGGFVGNKTTGVSTTGISINPSYTGITTTQNTGTGAAISILPPYYALCYIMKT